MLLLNITKAGNIVSMALFISLPEVGGELFLDSIR
jgi:hypothetical protein